MAGKLDNTLSELLSRITGHRERSKLYDIKALLGIFKRAITLIDEPIDRETKKWLSNVQAFADGLKNTLAQDELNSDEIDEETSKLNGLDNRRKELGLQIMDGAKASPPETQRAGHYPGNPQLRIILTNILKLIVCLCLLRWCISSRNIWLWFLFAAIFAKRRV